MVETNSTKAKQMSNKSFPCGEGRVQISLEVQICDEADLNHFAYSFTEGVVLVRLMILGRLCVDKALLPSYVGFTQSETAYLYTEAGHVIQRMTEMGLDKKASWILLRDALQGLAPAMAKNLVEHALTTENL